MGSLVAGTVVVLPFPFSDLTDTKRRPALIIADVGRDDYILCQITSNPDADTGLIRLATEDFLTGSLSRTSYVSPCQVFTGNVSLILYAVGLVNPVVLEKVRDSVINLIHGNAISPPPDADQKNPPA